MILKTKHQPRPFVSIIIPVYTHVQRLPLCIAGLAQQTYPRDNFEIILVNNGVNFDLDKTRFSRFTLRVMQCHTPGSYAARNCGIRHARGQILAFTDVDCVPSPQWLTEGVKALQTLPSPGLVGGKIVLEFPQSRLTAAQVYEKFWGLNQKKYLKQAHFAATANLFTFRKIFEEVGLFPETHFTGGDRQWGERLHRARYSQAYSPTAIVFHPARNTLKEIMERSQRSVGAAHETSTSLWQLFKKISVDIASVGLHTGWRIWRTHTLTSREKILFTVAIAAAHAAKVSKRIKLYYGKIPQRQ